MRLKGKEKKRKNDSKVYAEIVRYHLGESKITNGIMTSQRAVEKVVDWQAVSPWIMKITFKYVKRFLVYSGSNLLYALTESKVLKMERW